MRRAQRRAVYLVLAVLILPVRAELQTVGQAAASDDPPGDGGSSSSIETSAKSKIPGSGSTKAKSTSRRTKGSSAKGSSQTVVLQAIDEVKVRRMDPPSFYDDNGKPRKPTAAELKDLREPYSKTPGFLANFGDLDAGQTVKVTLGRKRAPPSLHSPEGGTKPAAQSTARSSPSTKPAAPGWLAAGELVGTITRVSRPKKTFSLQVDSGGSVPHGTQAGSGSKKGQQPVEDVWVTRIVILGK